MWTNNNAKCETGALLLYFASNMDEWLPESGKPNLKIIVYLLFIINLLNTTQDIIVDSWALTMLKKWVLYNFICIKYDYQHQ